MANITKRISKKGVISYRIKVFEGYDYNGRQITRSMTWTPETKTTDRQAEKEAQRQAIIFEDEVMSGKAPERHVKFADLANEYLSLVEQTGEMKLSSLTRLRCCRERTYKAIGKYLVEDITFRMIQSFIVELSKNGVNTRDGKGLSMKTQKHYLSFISDVMRYAIKCGIIQSNPCHGVSVVKTELKEREPYTLDEEILLLDLLDEKAPEKYQIFFRLLMFCGMRNGEALGLEWKDIDFDTGFCTIQRTSQYCDASSGVYTNTPKTKSSRRTLKLPDELLLRLRKYKMSQNIDRVNCGDQWHETDRLFTKYNGEPMHPNQPYNFLKKFGKREGFPFKGIHNFRHAFATEMIVSNRVDIKTISAILGHSLPSTTLNIYAHEVQSASAQAMDYVVDIFEKAVANKR